MYRKLALVALASLTPAMAMAQVDCSAAYALPAESKLVIQSANVGYYSSHSLSAFLPNPDVRRAVIMIHGLSGNVSRYYETLARSACRAQGDGLAPNVGPETVLLAPHFRSTDDDVRPAGYHYWNGDHWSRGSESATGEGVSSYAVLDALIAKLTGSVRMSPILPLQRRYPNLEMIVVAGFSAGGQFAHRYAGTNAKDGSVAGVQMRYVVGSPSSFLYLDDRRPYTDYSSGVGDPYTYYSSPLVSVYVRNQGFSDAPMCPTSYNDWKFGLEDLNNYSSAVGATTIRQRLLARRVTVVVGTADADPTDDNLDKTCPARLQGAHRYARALRFAEYLDIRFPWHHHAHVEVVGAGHVPESVFIGLPGGATLFVD